MTRPARVRLLALTLLLFASPAFAQTLFYVAEGPSYFNPDGAKLHVINTATGHRVQTVTLGAVSDASAPDVVIAPDSLTGYVTVGSDVVEFDTLTLAVIARIPTGRGHLGSLEMNAAGTRLYAAASDAIVVIDTASRTLDGTPIPLPAPPSLMALAPDASRLYVLRSDGPEFYIVDLASRGVTTVATGPGPSSIGVHPDGTRVYVAHRRSEELTSGHDLTAFDAVTGAQTGTMELPVFQTFVPFLLYPVQGRPGPMAVLSSGKIFLPRNASSWRTSPTSYIRNERVDIIDAASLTVLANVTPTGSGYNTLVSRIMAFAARDESLVYTFGDYGAGSIDPTSYATTALGTSAGFSGVTAAPAPPCWFEFQLGTLITRADGRQTSIPVDAPAGCAWSATAPEWMSLEPSSGSGPSTMLATIGPSAEPRIGTFGVNGQIRTVHQVIPTIVIDAPGNGSEITLPFEIGGWVIERGADGASGTGITSVSILDDLGGGSFLSLGWVSTGGYRPDIAAIFGTQYAWPGYTLRVGRLSAGPHTLLVRAVSARDGAFIEKSIGVTVRRNPQIVIESPAANADVTQPFTLRGWAADTTVPTGSGVDQVHVWAYPDGGGAPLFVGAAPANLPHSEIPFFFNDPTLMPGFEVSVSSLPPGYYTFVAYGHTVATNSFEITASVRLAVDNPQPAAPPFGTVDTPAEGALASGALNVSGWALDDTQVTRIAIYRDPVAGESSRIFIGDATFVEGARPDIAAAYPAYPYNTRGGWGLAVLTNMLPNGGNGTFTFEAEAHDTLGNVTTLGRRTVLVDNAASQIPFGTLDTPGQGQTVSGTIYNWGWALTPGTATIPADGSTIDVLIDDVVVGHPTYGLYREDIATLFPGYTNTNGAVGYFVIDTTTLTNGTHTIAWVVRDDLGRAVGIGSRYFFVDNP